MSAEPDQEVAALVTLTNMCQTFHCLPGSGGLWDQHPYIVESMKLVMMAQNEKTDKGT